MRKQNALTFLKNQHDEVKQLLEKLAATTDRGIKTRNELLGELDKKLRAHQAIEEEILYPAYKDAVSTKKDQKLYYEAMEEHHAAEHELKQLTRQNPATVAFGGKAKVLKELVEHHIDEEEKQLFSKLRELFSESDLAELGARMASRYQQIQAGRYWDSTNLAAQ